MVLCVLISVDLNDSRSVFLGTTLLQIPGSGPESPMRLIVGDSLGFSYSCPFVCPRLLR
jgi:hypothetical protein